MEFFKHDNKKFDEIYEKIKLINPVIPLRTGTNVNCNAKTGDHPFVWNNIYPSFIFKYAVTPNLIIYLNLVPENKSACGTCGYLASHMGDITGSYFRQFYGSSLGDQTISIIECGRNTVCGLRDPTTGRYCKKHYSDMQTNTVINFAKESILFSEIDKNNIFGIYYNGLINLTLDEIIKYSDKKLLFNSLLSEKNKFVNQHNDLCTELNEKQAELTTLIELRESLTTLGSKHNIIGSTMSQIDKQIADLKTRIDIINNMVATYDLTRYDKKLFFISVHVKPIIVAERLEKVEKFVVEMEQFDLETENKVAKLREERSEEKAKRTDCHNTEFSQLDNMLGQINKYIENVGNVGNI